MSQSMSKRQESKKSEKIILRNQHKLAVHWICVKQQIEVITQQHIDFRRRLTYFNIVM